MAQKPINKDKIEKLSNMYITGHTLLEISRELDISISTVHEYIYSLHLKEGKKNNSKKIEIAQKHTVLAENATVANYSGKIFKSKL